MLEGRDEAEFRKHVEVQAAIEIGLEKFLEERDYVRNGRTNLKHMRLQNPLFSGNKIVSIILHKRSTLRVLHIRRHNLHQAHHSSRLNAVDCKKVEKPMPKLPVATAFWTPQPNPT